MCALKLLFVSRLTEMQDVDDHLSTEHLRSTPVADDLPPPWLRGPKSAKRTIGIICHFFLAGQPAAVYKKYAVLKKSQKTATSSTGFGDHRIFFFCWAVYVSFFCTSAGGY